MDLPVLIFVSLTFSTYSNAQKATYSGPSISDEGSNTVIPMAFLTANRQETSKAHTSPFSMPSPPDADGHAVVETAPSSITAANQYVSVGTSKPGERISSTLNSTLETIDFSDVEMTAQNDHPSSPPYGPETTTIAPTSLIKPNLSFTTIVSTSEQMLEGKSPGTRQSITTFNSEERTSSPSHNVPSTLKRSTPIARKLSTEIPEDVPTSQSVLPGNSEVASPSSKLVTVDFSVVETTAQNDHDVSPPYGPKTTTIVPTTLIKPTLSVSVTTDFSTSWRTSNSNTLGTRQNVTTSVSPSTRKNKIPTKSPSKSSKATSTYREGSTTKVTSSLDTTAVLISKMMKSETLSSSIFAYANKTDHAVTTGYVEHASRSKKSWFNYWIIFIVAPIIVPILLLCLCYLFKRKYARYGQYKVVIKPIWVSSSPSALDMKEIHL